MHPGFVDTISCILGMIYLFFEGKNGEGHGPEAGQEAQQSCKEDTAWSAVNVTTGHGRAGSRCMPLPAILPNETRLETFQRVYCHAQHCLYAVGCLVHAQPSGEIPERAQNMFTLSLNTSLNFGSIAVGADARRCRSMAYLTLNPTCSSDP